MINYNENFKIKGGYYLTTYKSSMRNILSTEHSKTFRIIFMSRSYRLIV